MPTTSPHNLVEAFLKHKMHKRRIPGLQIAVIQHGEIILLGAYGVASVEHSVPVTNQTVFPIASATKSFTGVAIMQLAEDGKLAITDPLSRHFDDLPAAWNAVTIHQLLTHTSGIPNIMDANAKMLDAGGDAASWAKVQTLPMEYHPGERFSYNQTNYLLLGKIIDKLSGQPFTQFITERQLKVVGMPMTVQSGFIDSHDVVPHSAQTYTYFRELNGQYFRVNSLGKVFEVYPPFLRTGASLNSTAEEIARWLISIQQGRLLNQANLNTLWTAARLNDGSVAGFGGSLNGYALGWPVVDRPDHRAVGGIGGGRAAFYVYPDDDLSVVILTNLQGAAPESLLDEVAGYYIPDMQPSTGFGLPTTIRTLYRELQTRGFDQALAVVHELQANDAQFRLSEDDLNSWGYKLIEQEQIANAVEILKLNVNLYPDSANTYDSLAEGYTMLGEHALAIQNYHRSLELNPDNSNATERLKELEEK